MTHPNRPAPNAVAAEALFHQKLPLLRKIVSFRCMKNHIDIDHEQDILQYASMWLWRSCLKATAPGEHFAVSCEMVFLAGYSLWARERKRDHGSKMSVESMRLLAETPAREPASITVDGVTLTAADLRLVPDDVDGEVLDILENGITARELAKRVGLSHQAIMHRPEYWGGVSFPAGPNRRRWRFPRNAGRR